jgi:hypothetical protein
MRLIAPFLWWACHTDGDRKPGESQSVIDPADDSAPVDDTADDSGNLDRDGDGWLEPEDCDDENFDVHPTEPEECVNHIDDDCDGFVDRCDLLLEPNALWRFADPDGVNHVGFGSSMGFLERDRDVALWVSPQELSPGHVYRAYSKAPAPVAEISGAKGTTDYALGAIATEGDLDGDGVDDLVLCDMSKDRIVAHLFYDTMLGSATVDDASASITASGVWQDWNPTLPGAYALGDMTGDGTDDLLFSGMDDSWLLAGPISGDTALSNGGSTTAAWEAQDVWFVTAVDFDGDGLDDLAILSAGGLDSSATGIEYIVKHDATEIGDLATVADARIVGGVADRIGQTRGSVADFDRDGVSDLVVSSCEQLPESNGDGYVSVLLGPFAGQLIADEDANLVLRGPKDGWPGYNVVAGEWDGDHIVELAIASVVLDDNDDYAHVVDVVTPGLLFGP